MLDNLQNGRKYILKTKSGTGQTIVPLGIYIALSDTFMISDKISLAPEDIDDALLVQDAFTLQIQLNDLYALIITPNEWPDGDATDSYGHGYQDGMDAMLEALQIEAVKIKENI